MNKRKFTNSVFCIHLLSVASLLVVLNTPSVSAKELKQSSLRQLRVNTTHLLAQTPTPAVVIQITGVKINSTTTGFEIILETKEGKKLQINSNTEGNSYIANIANAQLQGDSFRQEKPAPGIAEITVFNQDANTIRVTLVGIATAPTVELFDSDEGLIIGFTNVASTTKPQQQTQATPEQPTTETIPKEPTAENQKPIELVVTGEQDNYRVEESSTATKIDAPLRDIPASVQVIPRQVIEDRQVVRLNELANNVSGVQLQSGYGGLSSQGYFIRGFESGFETLRNGFRDFGFLSPRDVANVERVEFLKGPASVLYGSANNPGGVVNTITKKPLPEPFYRAGMTIGSYDFYRPTLDLTGPLTEDKSVLYRLNAAYENAGSFRDFNENESVFISPVISVNISERTNITFEYEYQNYQYIFDRGLPPNRISFDVPISRSLVEPDLPRSELRSSSFTYNFEHQFSDDWKFRQGFSLISVNGVTQTIQDTGLEPDGQTFRRRYRKVNEDQENISWQNEISGKFNTGSISHNFLVGLELASYDFSYEFFRASIAPLNIINPVYGAQRGDLTPDFFEGYGGDNVAVYFQDLITLTPNIKLLAGGRFDWVDSTYQDLSANSFDLKTSDSEFSPRVGIVYQPSDTTSIYASWTNSFNPQFFGRSRTGEQFKPETAEQFEVGIKQELFNKRLSATLAYFDITKQNVLVTDPNDVDFQIQTGEQKSRGIELDVAGEIIPGWKVIATYAYIDAYVSKDRDQDLVNDRLQAVPYNSASLWTTYEFQKGSLQGLGFGLGLVYVDEREATLPNSLKIPSYIRTDASIFYRRDNWRAAINIKNLFDTEYYESQRFYLVPGAPLTVLGTVSFDF
ncbi:TonB-dependent siderophore receptor [Nostoc sp. MS1]|uniref:TonB-dependent siderophore receptor n=1 Tax=Nostoc sp. MS1 TaxID=2764711 RepID=UPI001CC4C2A7|nr:TonB-dependent siderophore receptor [Nostoc sp. MS1]BCL34199.1 ferrichrome-iron receptor [Nostoc sp. MS1]